MVVAVDRELFPYQGFGSESGSGSVNVCVSRNVNVCVSGNVNVCVSLSVISHESYADSGIESGNGNVNENGNEIENGNENEIENGNENGHVVWCDTNGGIENVSENAPVPASEILTVSAIVVVENDCLEDPCQHQNRFWASEFPCVSLESHIFLGAIL